MHGESHLARIVLFAIALLFRKNEPAKRLKRLILVETNMKKFLLIIALLGVLGFTSQANAGVHVGIGVGVGPGYYGYGPGYYGGYPYYPYGPYYYGPGVYFGPGYYPWYHGYWRGGYYHGGYYGRGYYGHGGGHWHH